MSDRYAEAVSEREQKVSDLPGQAPFEGDQYPAKDLIGQTFAILKAKRMTSTKGKGKGGPDHFYLCQIKRADGKLYRTLLGGIAVIPILDAWAEDPMRGILKATLNQIEGGEFGKYYTIE